MSEMLDPGHNLSIRKAMFTLRPCTSHRSSCSRHNDQLVIGQGPLQLQRLSGWRCEPLLRFRCIPQNDWHRFLVNGLDSPVRLTGKKPEELVIDLTLFYLPNTFPDSPNAREKEQWLFR